MSNSSFSFKHVFISKTFYNVLFLSIYKTIQKNLSISFENNISLYEENESTPTMFILIDH